MITAEQKRVWLEALRSGQYKQGRYFLRTGNSYCCLGVACEVFGPGFKGSGDNPYRAVDTGAAGLWYGNASGPQQRVMGQAAVLNDELASFEEIADYLEANLDVTEKK